MQMHATTMVWISKKRATVFDLSLLQTKKARNWCFFPTGILHTSARNIRQQGCENFYTATTGHARPDYVAHPCATFACFICKRLIPQIPIGLLPRGFRLWWKNRKNTSHMLHVWELWEQESRQHEGVSRCFKYSIDDDRWDEVRLVPWKHFDTSLHRPTRCR